MLQVNSLRVSKRKTPIKYNWFKCNRCVCPRLVCCLFYTCCVTFPGHFLSCDPSVGFILCLTLKRDDRLCVLKVYWWIDKFYLWYFTFYILFCEKRPQTKSPKTRWCRFYKCRFIERYQKWSYNLDTASKKACSVGTILLLSTSCMLYTIELIASPSFTPSGYERQI